MEKSLFLPSAVSDEFNLLYQKIKFWLLLSFKHLGSYSDDWHGLGHIFYASDNFAFKAIFHCKTYSQWPRCIFSVVSMTTMYIVEVILAATLIQAFRQLFRSLTWIGPRILHKWWVNGFHIKHIVWQYFIAKPTPSDPGVFLVVSPWLL